MIEITDSNDVFEGAKVKYNQEDYYVYKVNTKTMYIGKTPYAEIIHKWKNKPKNLTWKNFMNQENGSMVSLISCEICDKQEKTKLTATKIKKQKSPISKIEEKTIEELFAKFKKRKGGYKTPLFLTKKFVLVLDFNENEWATIRVDNNKFLFDIKNYLFIKFDKKKHKEGNNIKYPNRTN